MNQSWLVYFRFNQSEPQEIPWELAQPPDAEMATFLIPSLEQFQVGEGASGLTFLELGRRYAARSGNLDFVETLALFIAEEQRHSAMLGRYLRLTGHATLNRPWLDRVFRRLRKLAGLECMVTVLVSAEIIAIPYYRSVARITNCPTLRAICRRILREEAQHLLFQGSTLGSLQSTRPQWWIRLTHGLQHLFLVGTCVAAWTEHRRVFQSAGLDWLSFLMECRALLRHVQRASSRMQWVKKPSRLSKTCVSLLTHTLEKRVKT